jgi:hypothetical protein
MSLATAKELLEAIVAYNKVKDGDSGDAEHDAGNDLQAAAIEHLRDEAVHSADISELVNSYGEILDNDVEEA